MQETLWDIEKPLTRTDLHPHWWLNPLEPTLQPVAPWNRVQPPVRTRRRGRPKISVVSHLHLKLHYQT